MSPSKVLEPTIRDVNLIHPHESDTREDSGTIDENDSLNIVDAKYSTEDIENDCSFATATDGVCTATENDGIDHHHVYLFYNPTSGGNSATVLADPALAQADLYYGNICAHLKLYDIRDGETKKKPGFLKLKETLNTVKSPLSVRVIVGGGDGTVMWCISEMRASEIDLSKVSIGVVPFGTGNDFARALFWDTRFEGIRSPKAELRELVYQWLTADIVPHDLWDVSVQLHDIGTFRRINPQTRHKQVLTEFNSKGQRVPLRVANHKMCNYFSIGVESRIGVGFDRYRTKSRFWNKVRYAAEGWKKSFLMHTMKINEIVSALSIINQDTKVQDEVFHCVPSTPFDGDTGSDYLGLRSVDSMASFDVQSVYRYSSSHYGQLASFRSSMSRQQSRCDDKSNNHDKDDQSTIQCDCDTCDYSEPPSVRIITLDKNGNNQVNTRDEYACHMEEESSNIGDDSCVETQSNPVTDVHQRHASHALRTYRTIEYTNRLSTSARSLPSKHSESMMTVNSYHNSPQLLPAASLIAINIPSFAAGLDIWNSAHRVGVEVIDDSPNAEHLLRQPQKMGDKLLEFLTFSSAASFGFERVLGLQGRGKRVCQSQGPFILDFNVMPRSWRTYYQVDGEFYVVSNPARIQITHDCTVGVLANPKSPYRKSYVMPQCQSDDLSQFLDLK